MKHPQTWAIPIVVIAAIQIAVSNLISYPPTEDQLSLIFSFLEPLSPSLAFLLIRFFSLTLVLTSLFIFRGLVRKFFGMKVATIASVVLALSPTTFASWNLHPWDSLKVFLVALLLWLLLSLKRRAARVLTISALVLALLFLARNQPRTNIPIFNALNPATAGEEILNRLYTEAKIQPRIEIPLPLKRISYNKIFFVWQNVLREVVSFGDFEALFFQEVHPLGQKSFVLFFWPEILFFVLGLYLLLNEGRNRQRSFLLLLLAVSFADFLFLAKPSYQRFFLPLFPLSLVIAFALGKLSRRLIFSGIITTVIAFSTLTNYFDLFQRPSFWFDNRPLVYQFFFETLRGININNFQNVFVTSLVGRPELYCRFYREDCSSGKFVFRSFNLMNEQQPKTIYAGFIGEFLGPQERNIFPSNWTDFLKGKGLRLVKSYQTRDSIAFKYGDGVAVAIKD